MAGLQPGEQRIQNRKNLLRSIEAEEAFTSATDIVKELVSNSLDAKATCVQVTIDGHITVGDDGPGITVSNRVERRKGLWTEIADLVQRTDATRVCENSATSKIRREVEIATALTGGYRGQSLAHISHKFPITVTSKPGGEECAWTATFLAGRPRRAAPSSSGVSNCQASDGTTVTVRSTEIPPAEVTKIEKMLKALSVKHRDTSFRMTVEAKQRRSWRSLSAASGAAECIQHYFGHESSALTAFQGKYDRHKAHWTGFYSHLKTMASHTCLVFINGQMVNLPGLRKGFSILYLDCHIDPQLVERNIDLRKRRVHLFDESALTAEILRSTEIGACDTTAAPCKVAAPMPSFVAMGDSIYHGLLQEHLLTNFARTAPWIGQLKFVTIVPRNKQLLLLHGAAHQLFSWPKMLATYLHHKLMTCTAAKAFQRVHVTSFLQRATSDLRHAPVSTDQVQALKAVLMRHANFIHDTLHIQVDQGGYVRDIPDAFFDIGLEGGQLPYFFMGLAEYLATSETRPSSTDCLFLAATLCASSVEINLTVSVVEDGSAKGALQRQREKAKRIFEQMMDAASSGA